MKNNLQQIIKNRLFLILVLILAVALAAGIPIAYIISSENNLSVENVIITNVTDTAFTITWTSTEPYIGKIAYKTATDRDGNEKNWPAVFAQNGGEIAYDDRDVELDNDGKYVQVSGGLKKRYTHHVTLRNLTPETEYLFRVHARFNGKKMPIESASTKELATDINTPDPGYGAIKGADNNDTIVYIGNSSDGKETVELLSVPVSGSFGTYSFDANYFGQKDLKANSLFAKIVSAGKVAPEYTFRGEGYKPLEVISLAEKSSIQGKFNPIIQKVSAAVTCQIAQGTAKTASPSSTTVRLRSRPSTSSDANIIVNVSVGTDVEVIACVTEDSNTSIIWYQVRVGSNEGYIRGDLLSNFAGTGQGSAPTASGGAQPVIPPTTEGPVVDEGGAPTAPTSPTGQLSCGTNTISVRVGSSNLNLRQSAAATANRLATIPAGTVVAGCAEQGGWHNVRYNDNVGYVSADYADPSDDAATPSSPSTIEPVPTQPTIPQEQDRTAFYSATDRGTGNCTRFNDWAQCRTHRGCNDATFNSAVKCLDNTELTSICFSQPNSEGCQEYNAANDTGVAPDSGIVPDGTTYQCSDSSGRTYTSASPCPDGAQPVATTTGSGDGSTQEVDVAVVGATTGSSSESTCPSGVRVGGAGLDNDRKCALVDPHARAIGNAKVYFNPASNTGPGQIRTIDPFVGVSPFAVSQYLDVNRHVPDCTTGGWGTQTGNPCFRRLMETLPQDTGASRTFDTNVLIIFSSGYASSTNFAYIIPEEAIENQYTHTLGVDFSIDGHDGTYPRVVYEFLTAAKRCYSTPVTNPSYDFTLQTGTVIRRAGFCAYKDGIEASSSCNEAVLRTMAVNAIMPPIRDDGYACLNYLETTLRSYAVQPNSPLDAGLSFQTYAQENTTTSAGGNSIEVKDPGTYNLFDGAANTTLFVDIQPNQTAIIRMFQDNNQNGIKDAAEDYLSDLGQYKLSKTADVVTYNLNYGWNLIHVPVVSTSVRKASDLASALYDSKLEPTQVVKFEGGKFVPYSHRQDALPFSADFNLIPGEGYFVKVDKPGKLTISGNAIEEPVKLERLSNGWNLVGLVSPDKEYQSDTLLTSMKGQNINADIISRYENGLYYSVISEEGTIFGNNYRLNNKSGYFLRVQDSGGNSFTP